MVVWQQVCPEWVLAVSVVCHTWYGMKMTMPIDEALLDRVIESYGFVSKTEAVETALRELDRRTRFRELGRLGLEMTPEEIRKAVDPDYDLTVMRGGVGLKATRKMMFPPFGNAALDAAGAVLRVVRTLPSTINGARLPTAGSFAGFRGAAMRCGWRPP